jgi:L-iditol 2-dehydrogenase
MSLVEGALIEPFAVGLHAANQGGAGLGQTAVVFGAGCIGLMSLLALKAQGVSRIFVTDTIDRRLAKASELGATAIFNPAQIDIVQKINEMTDGRGCDLVIETSGAEAAAQNAIYIARRGGKIVFVGYSPSGNVTIPLGRALDKELSFETVFRYRISIRWQLTRSLPDVLI